MHSKNILPPSVQSRYQACVWRTVFTYWRPRTSAHRRCIFEKKNVSPQLWDRRFRRNSSLQAMCDTPIARIARCESSLYVYYVADISLWHLLRQLRVTINRATLNWWTFVFLKGIPLFAPRECEPAQTGKLQAREMPDMFSWQNGQEYGPYMLAIYSPTIIHNCYSSWPKHNK